MRLFTAVFLGAAISAANAADLPPLNTPATDESHPGKMIWADLFTSNPAAAEAFYTGLLGWKATPVERTTHSGVRTYHVLSVGDRPVAGIVIRPSRMKDEVNGRWVGYVAVADVDASVRAAEAAGGKAVTRVKTLANRGTQALLTDPEGAEIGVMHSDSGDPGEYLPEPGDWAWAEYFARNPSATCRFFNVALGYEVIPDARDPKPGSFVLVSGGYSRVGVNAASPDGQAHPGWLFFVRVADAAASAQRAVELGGTVVVPVGEPAARYRRAVIADPSGARIGIVELPGEATGGNSP